MKSKLSKIIIAAILGLGIVGSSFALTQEKQEAGCYGSFSNGSGEIVPCQ